MSAAKLPRPQTSEPARSSSTPAPSAALNQTSQTREEEVTVMELTLADVHRLSQLLGYNIQTPAELITKVQRMTTISVDGCEIQLGEGLLSRLKSRALSQWGPEWLGKQVRDLLHGYCGW